MMGHEPGLAARPPVRNNLEVGERNTLPFGFSAADRQSPYEARGAARSFLEQRRRNGESFLIAQQTLLQASAN